MDFPAQFRAFAQTADANARLRFAPTPSGYLHIGNALNFVLNWLLARLNGGKILLRIDDLDAERKRPEYVADVFENLLWLELDWDEGPISPEDFEKNWSQRLRLPLYFKQLDKLRATGLLFACRKSRRDLEPFDGQYPPGFRRQGIPLDEPDAAWRVDASMAKSLADFIVRRRDGLPAYQVASLADDLFFGITHVVRGADLGPSTASQRFLAECLNEDNFLTINFLHHPLLTDEHGAKLSKSEGAAALKTLRAAGESPTAVFRRVGALLDLEGDSATGLLDSLKKESPSRLTAP
jgi:glutamyl-tRNA synthetase